MPDFCNWFVRKQDNGYVDLFGELPAGYDLTLDVPSIVCPEYLGCYSSFAEIVDARGVVHKVTMMTTDDYDDYPDAFCWYFCGDEWTELMKSVEKLCPKFIHLEKFDLRSYYVNFYTAAGDEVDYGCTRNHVWKSVVFGCEDPRFYQPIPVGLLSTCRRFRREKRVPIDFDGVVFDVGVRFSMLTGVRDPVAAAFTGSEWEGLCEGLDFSSSKVLVISEVDYGQSFSCKVLDKYVPEKVWYSVSLGAGAGESSISRVSGKSFDAVFGSCAENKGYLSIPASFHGHSIAGRFRAVWLKAGDKSLYMCLKIHIDPRLKSEKDKNVFLEGDMHRLKSALGVYSGEAMRFVLVSGSLTSDDVLSFDVSRLV